MPNNKYNRRSKQDYRNSKTNEKNKNIGDTAVATRDDVNGSNERVRNTTQYTSIHQPSSHYVDPTLSVPSYQGVNSNSNLRGTFGHHVSIPTASGARGTLSPGQYRRGSAGESYPQQQHNQQQSSRGSRGGGRGKTMGGVDAAEFVPMKYRPQSYNDSYHQAHVHTRGSSRRVINNANYNNATSYTASCFKCGEVGHIGANCPNRQQHSIEVRGRGGRGRGRSQGFQNSCFRCGQQGHIGRDCPEIGKSDYKGSTSSNNAEKELKVKYDRIIKSFIDDDDLNELVFPYTLSALERQLVHKIAMHYGLGHTSVGPKESRVLTVTKVGGLVGGGNVDKNDEDSTDCPVSLTPDGKEILKTIDGFQGLQPLNDHDFSLVHKEISTIVKPLHANMVKNLEAILKGQTVTKVKNRFASEKVFRGPPPQQHQRNIAEHKKLLAFRETLPSYKIRDNVVESVRNNDVVIISGDTGCGKTTQIPQILDDANIFSKGSVILCTQPRRISALSVAQRVAKERGEVCGNSVGYVIRFDNVTSSATRIAYVTTGILLRRMHSDPDLTGVSCVVVDEVHERDLDTDFALLLLRDIIRSQTANDRKIKLVIMSATIQIDRLTAYFNIPTRPPPPLLSISGMLFPVQEYWLEDALEWLKLPASAAAAMRALNRDIDESPTVIAASPTVQDTNDNTEVPVDSAKMSKEYAQLYQAAELLKSKEEELAIPFDVIVGVIELFHERTTESKDSSVLVFLPGWSQIDRVAGMLRRSKYSKEFSVHMLHSSIPSQEQERVFYPAPKGFRKIVLATNIAETSITIDDVVLVVDSCVLRGTSYDCAGNTTSLKSQHISKANGIQRRGRAGRVRRGICVHLLPKSVYDSLPDFLDPEMLRSPLEEVCLQIKAIREDEPCIDVLSRAIDPPSITSIAHSVKMLKDLAAFDHREKLTNLGRALATLPLHPSLGKMLLVASAVGVLMPIAVIASALGGKSPFIRPMPFQQADFDRAKTNLDNGDASDHFSILKLFKGYIASNSRYQYAMENYADVTVLKGIERSSKQFVRLVSQSGFLNNVVKKELAKNNLSGQRPKDNISRDQQVKIGEAFASRHQDNSGFIKMALLWSLYPKIGCFERHKTRSKGEMFCWDNKPCFTHNSSVLFKAKINQLNNREFFMFFERMKIESVLNIMDMSAVSRVMALLVSKNVTVHSIVQFLDIRKEVNGAAASKAPECKHISENNENDDNIGDDNGYSDIYWEDPGCKYKAFDPVKARDLPISTTAVLRMDLGKKLFCLPKVEAESLRNLREVMEYYFSLAIKSVDVSLFPEDLVKAIGLAIHYPVQAFDLDDLVKRQIGSLVAAVGKMSSVDEVGQITEEEHFEWNNQIISDESSDYDDKHDNVENVYTVDMEEGCEIDVLYEALRDDEDSGKGSDKKNILLDEFGDLSILRRAKNESSTCDDKVINEKDKNPVCETRVRNDHIGKPVTTTSITPGFELGEVIETDDVEWN